MVCASVCFFLVPNLTPPSSLTLLFPPLVSIMFVIWTVVAAWKWKDPHGSLLLDFLYCKTICAVEPIVPTPPSHIWRIFGITLPFVDPIPFLFGVLYFMGMFLPSSSHESSSTSCSTTATGGVAPAENCTTSIQPHNNKYGCICYGEVC